MQWLRILPANCSYKKEQLWGPSALWLPMATPALHLTEIKRKKKCATYPKKRTWQFAYGLFSLSMRHLHFLWLKSSKPIGVKSTRKNIGSRYLKITNFFLKGSWWNLQPQLLKSASSVISHTITKCSILSELKTAFLCWKHANIIPS